MNLQDTYNRETFLGFIKDFIPGFNTDVRAASATGLQVTEKVVYLGENRDFDLSVFEITHNSTKDARVKLAMDGFKVMKSSAVFRALIVYRSEKSDDWRLSLMTATLSPNQKGSISQTFSNPRRFSFFLGPNAKVNTPNRFLVKEGPVKSFEDLQKRFSLEVVNKEFYKGISESFTKLVGGEIGKGKNKKTYNLSLQLPSNNSKNKATMEFAVRLIGRIIFCWFLREKKGQNSVSLMPKELLSSEAILRNQNYYHSVLEPIFFEVLNKEMRSREDKWNKGPFSQIPYLNGGLFSPQYDDYYDLDRGILISRHINTLVIPDTWFIDFFNILESYNFTIDENTSFDEELSIDPEMLGRIFENLLAEINPETGESARKSTGSFYTPRAIVDYMVDESIVLFLKQKTEIEESKIRALISYDLIDDEQHPLKEEEKQKIIDALEKLKLLDPACGSGAFPMGALQKIVYTLQRVDPDAQLWFNKQIANTAPEIRRVIEREFKHKNFDYIRKLGVIRENIYGIDIQAIAIEISRLRCFLTLVVDERIDDSLENRGIEPLPNLDFKFVVANSLIGLKSSQEATEGLFKDQEGINRLKTVREQYFNATNSERYRLQREFDSIQKQMFNRMVQLKEAEETTHKLSLWEPFENKLTPWFDPEWMFGIENGFDVVIGNPPYLESRHPNFSEQMKNSAQLAAKNRWKEDSSYIVKGADLLIYFYESGINLISENGHLVLIVQNSWLDTDYGKKFQKFLLKHTNVLSIIDSDLKHFDGPNINTVITIFSGKNPVEDNEILFSKFGINNSNTNHIISSVGGLNHIELHRISYSNPLLTETKWGVVLVSSKEILEMLEIIQKRGTLLKDVGLTVGQGLNISRETVVDQNIICQFPFLDGKLIPFMNTGSPFELLSVTQYLINESKLTPEQIGLLSSKKIETFNPQTTKRVPPLLILPRGVSKHFCALNSAHAYTSSCVEIYGENTEENTVMNLWCFLNSSVAWILREVTGRKNLGGGLLKAEATDIRAIPIYFDLGSQDRIKEIFNQIKLRQAKITLQEIDTDEHRAIDNIVFERLGIKEENKNRLVSELKNIISRRSSKSKNKLTK